VRGELRRFKNELTERAGSAEAVPSDLILYHVFAVNARWFSASGYRVVKNCVSAFNFLAHLFSPRHYFQAADRRLLVHQVLHFFYGPYAVGSDLDFVF
jgi:hypothetical protein